jgi:indole-3-glycerol phosphate synthase
MNRLEEILRVKREEVKRLKPRRANLDRSAKGRIRRGEQVQNAFTSALQQGDEQLAVIAEVKKASPSAGVIAKSFDPAAIVKNYEHAGANAISVLTDTKFFQGSPEDLVKVRKTVSLPLLRKDFILDEIQVIESKAIGADAILLIVAALEQAQLVDLIRAAESHKLDALIEVHTHEELHRALEAGAKIVGINNRNLATFDVDLAVTEELCREVPDEIILVSESGIKTPRDVSRMKACGVDAILVGEALMRGETSIAELRGAL